MHLLVIASSLLLLSMTTPQHPILHTTIKGYKLEVKSVEFALNIRYSMVCNILIKQVATKGKAELD